jgi:superfamily II DNA or RNA helicase
MTQPSLSEERREPTRWQELPLWDNQVTALKKCLAYLRRPERSALVQMPTGSGKTGVIAVLAALLSEKGAVLVISPSRSLADQLASDIREGFWKTIKARGWNPEITTTVQPSAIDQLLRDLKNKPRSTVLVGTFQALSQIRRESEASYKELAMTLSLVLVDEGHREPSRDWGLTIRKLSRPSILFTATPYRNDLRVFDISPEHVAYLSFSDAVRRKLIRDVNFSLAEISSVGDVFAQQVIREYDRLKLAGKLDADARVIIRCADEDRVRNIYECLVAGLVGRKEKCKAIHHQFDHEDDDALTSIAAIRDGDETFLVHQFKLMEGLDDPRCAMLALYDGFSTDRQFVQQVGRILRNRNPGKNTQPGFVIATAKQNAVDTWERYKSFDQACSEQGGNPFLRSDDFIDELIGKLPDHDYIHGRFRKRPDFDKNDVSRELLVPQSAVVYRVEPQFNFENLKSTVREAIEDEDRYLKKAYHLPDLKCSVFFSVQTSQSPFLSESTFPDFILTVTVIKRAKNYLFFYDSAGLWIDDVLNTGDRISSTSLYCLFPAHGSVRISSMSVKNADMSQFAVRSRTVTASSIAEAAPFMGDNTNFVSRAGGSTSQSKRRYVGFTRARVRDDGPAAVTIDGFSDWAESVAVELDAQSKTIPLFGRFASPTDPPGRPEPRNILLDVEDFEEQFIRGSATLRVENLCCEVHERDPQKTKGKYGHEFDVSTNGSTYPVLIRYDLKRRRYILKSRDLNRFVSKNNPRLTLTMRLNRRQAFRIVPVEPGVFYAYRQFYTVQLKLSEKSANSFVLDFLTPVTELDVISSEKGAQVGEKTVWQKNSLFAFLDEALTGKHNAKPLGPAFPAVVCDDMGTEAADFIAVDRKGSRIVFVHGKAMSTDPGVSASKLHDVCGQAIKNLEFVRFGGRPMAGRKKKWERPWKAATKKDKSDDPGYEVSPRIRRGPTNSGKLNDLIESLLLQPNAQREVWLALGRILSKTKFEDQLAKKNPDGFALQTFFLLASTFSACKSVGVDLKVFCSK